MSMYWLNPGCWCPLDRGLLECSGEVTLKIYTCPDCGKQFVFTAGGEIPISDGFVRPKEVRSTAKKNPCFAPGKILTMTVPARW